MAWYAYCVTERQSFPELLRHRKPVALDTTTGIDGNQVFLYPAGDLAVLVSEHGLSPTDGQRSAKEHTRVVTDCFRVATVLPFRFGTVFANDELLRRSIRSNQRQLLVNLSELQGKSEMHIKLTLDDCCREQVREAAVALSSRTYLTDLRESATRQRERQTRARSLSMQLNRMFLPLAEEVSCRRLDTGKMQLDVSHLIYSRQVERYGNKFQAAREIMRDCQLQLSGPWPPYHFVHSLTRNLTRNAPAPADVLPAQPRAIPA